MSHLSPTLTHAQLPIISIFLQIVHFSPQRNLHQHVIINQSIDYLRFHTQNCAFHIMAYAQHYHIIQSIFTALKILCIPPIHLPPLSLPRFFFFLSFSKHICVRVWAKCTVPKLIQGGYMLAGDACEDSVIKLVKNRRKRKKRKSKITIPAVMHQCSLIPQLRKLSLEDEIFFRILLSVPTFIYHKNKS